MTGSELARYLGDVTSRRSRGGRDAGRRHAGERDLSRIYVVVHASGSQDSRDGCDHWPTRSLRECL